MRKESDRDRRGGGDRRQRDFGRREGDRRRGSDRRRRGFAMLGRALVLVVSLAVLIEVIDIGRIYFLGGSVLGHLRKPVASLLHTGPVPAGGN